ncbi:unnamed protein product [Parnassius apollo]|uniref:(apollo) hypothetical protein n=1 Tax=Parnassius apollo TaxID=110799 RepID=A0A8S3Y7D2_PARAO|nr:unnamed protein product [Parnassius apollo]
MIPSNIITPLTGPAARKSRLEGKPSMLPKPRRTGSTNRLSPEVRRPSASYRSSSVEPPRVTFGGGRLSREASATKLPMIGRSRSQQGESKYGQSTTTPLRPSHYSRPTTTPERTPSKDRSNSWQTSLDRALAFVTIKDQRPISSAAWQRVEYARVTEALAGADGAPSMVLLRPLSITRFVDIVGALLSRISGDAKLNNDNYITKVPHQSKRLLYPGTVSKSWLRTVNTLHAFPHALALFVYLLDLANHIETPVEEEWLWMEKDEMTCLRRDYLYQCWLRFQDPGYQFDDLNKKYLQDLSLLLGNDEEKIGELQLVIKKYSACLEDEAEAEAAASAEEAQRNARRDALSVALRAERAQCLQTRAQANELRSALHDKHEALRLLDLEIERAQAEIQRLQEEVAQQPLSVSERTRLLDELDYALRVHDSKRALADQISKMVLNKETELALWQKKTLDSCVEYNKGLVHLAAEFPELLAYAIDEKELMGAEIAENVAARVAALRERVDALTRARAHRAAERAARQRQRARRLEEAQSKLAELKSFVEREQQLLDNEDNKESAEEAAWSSEKLEISKKLEELQSDQEHHAKLESELEFWEKQDLAWRSKLSAMCEYIELQKQEAKEVLEEAKEKRIAIVRDTIRVWNEKLDQCLTEDNQPGDGHQRLPDNN